MLYSLIRPLLFQLDAERAHHKGIGVARYISRHRLLANAVHRHFHVPMQPRTIAGLTFPNPIGLAAGLDKNAEAPLAWWAFGFGFCELGTVTPLSQPGKDKPRLFRFPEKRALVNRMGFNNDGAATVAERLTEQKQLGLRPAFPIGLSIGKNAVTPAEKSAEDYAKAAALLAPLADYLAVNISSPNTAGLRNLQSATELTTILNATRSAAGDKPIFVKLAPELSGDDLLGVLDACQQHGAAGVIATNTLATHGRDGLPEGGLSGRPLREISRKQVELIRKHLDPKLALIGCGGVEDAATAKAMFDAGADLVQLYSALIYNGPGLVKKTLRGLTAIKQSSPSLGTPGEG